MNPSKGNAPKIEATPVDDVRLVREKLSGECGNDVNCLADRARKTAESLREKLGLTRADSGSKPAP